MKKGTTVNVTDELKQGLSKKGHRYWYDKGQPELRLLDSALAVAPVKGIISFVNNLEALHGTRDTVRLLEYVTLLTADAVGTKDEVIDDSVDY